MMFSLVFIVNFQQILYFVLVFDFELVNLRWIKEVELEILKIS